MEITNIDKSNMRKTILDFPKQFQIGIEAAKNVKVSGRFNKILVCAMGGSALPADILNIWMDAYKIGLPLYIHRDYGLPRHVNNKQLVICISYSGNTEETLSAFEQARKERLKIIAIASGGKLAELCKKYGIPLAIVPKGYQPRMVLGFQFAALMRSLVNCKVIKNDKLKNVSALEKDLKPKKLENQSKNLAKKLKGRIPIIYTSNKLGALARIWKIKFNENSKTLALANYFPELNHNEITGFENPQGMFHLILLRNPADHPRVQKRMKLTAEIIKTKRVRVDIIEMKGKDILYKIFTSLLLADWTSYYLALEYGIDPTPVKLQEKIKKWLKKNES